jgi:WD40 repeat protein
LWRVKNSPVAIITREHPFSADFLPDDKGIVTAAANEIKVFGLDGHCQSSFRSEFPISCSTTEEKGELVLTGGKDGAARLFGLNGDLKAEFRPNVRHSMTGEVDAMFSRGGKHVLTLQYNTVTIWTLDGKHRIDLVHDTGGAMTSVRFSEDERFVLTAGLDKGGARLWGIDGRLQARFPDEDYYVTVAEFWPEGGKVLTCGSAPKLWSPSGNLIRTFAIPEARRVIVLNHAMVMVPTQSTTAGLWNLEGELIAQLEHDDYVTQAAVSPDGCRILTVAGHRVSLWDLAGNLLTVVDHAAEVRSAQLSPTGDYCLVLSSCSGTLWDCFSPKRIIEYYKARIPPLNDAERQSFLGSETRP